MLFFGKIETGKLTINSTDKFKEFINSLEGQTIQISITKKADTRSLQQNKALHKYFTQVAEQMAGAGYTVQHILKFTADLQPTSSFVKRLWQEFQLQILGKRQTRKLLKSAEIDKVYDELNLFLAEKLKLENIPWPSRETIDN